MYTTKERNEIYKKVLFFYESMHLTEYGLGLCFAISEICRHNKVYSAELRKEYYPEFDLFFDYCEVYFDLNEDLEDFYVRQTILSFCIAMTEQ